MTARPDQGELERVLARVESTRAVHGAEALLAAEVVALRAERDFHEERYKQEHRTRHAMEDTITALRAELAEARGTTCDVCGDPGCHAIWDRHDIERARQEIDRDRAAREAAERERDDLRVARQGLQALYDDLEERAEAAEAREKQLLEALERIARAGEGIPDWRAMSDCARAALGSAAAADTTDDTDG